MGFGTLSWDENASIKGTMKRFVALFALICPQLAFAETILSPEEFEAFSENRTLYFSQSGQHYGTEQYFEGRIVTWKDSAGQCQNGFWVTSGDAICFYYEKDPDPHCWHVLQTTSGISVRLLGGDPIDDLNMTALDDQDIVCPAPFLGV